jgi:hypothetical protein
MRKLSEASATKLAELARGIGPKLDRFDSEQYSKLKDFWYELRSILRDEGGARAIFRGQTGLIQAQVMLSECNPNEVQREQWAYTVVDAPEWVGPAYSGYHGHVKQGSGRFEAKRRATDAAMEDLIGRKILAEAGV